MALPSLNRPTPSPFPIRRYGRDRSVSPPLPTVEEVATATVSPKTTTVSVGRGDTLMRLLTKNDVPRTDAHAVVTALEPVFDLRRLQIGQEFALTFTPEEDGQGGLGRLEGVQFAAAPGKDIEVSLESGDGWVARSIEHALVRKDSRVAGSIETSLYDAALAAEMPIDILLRMIRLFSYDVDFQRDIQPGDSFDVLFERDLNDEGDVVKLGEMVYAAMTLSGKEYAYYRHTPQRFHRLFDKNGKSVRKAPMRTPINGARLTSRFGKRKHPFSATRKCTGVWTLERLRGRRSWPPVTVSSTTSAGTVPTESTSGSGIMTRTRPPMPICLATQRA